MNKLLWIIILCCSTVCGAEAHVSPQPIGRVWAKVYVVSNPDHDDEFVIKSRDGKGYGIFRIDDEFKRLDRFYVWLGPHTIRFARLDDFEQIRLLETGRYKHIVTTFGGDKRVVTESVVNPPPGGYFAKLGAAGDGTDYGHIELHKGNKCLICCEKHLTLRDDKECYRYFRETPGLDYDRTRSKCDFKPDE